MQCTDAVAFEAAAALEAYEDQLLAMRRLGAQPWRVALLQKELRRVCNGCMGLQQLAGTSVALLLAHHRLLAELVHRGENDAPLPGAARLDEVEQCVTTLQLACRKLFLAPHLQ